MNKNSSFRIKPLSLAVLLSIAFESYSADYLTPALTQGDDFNGLVWWHEGALYAKDINGDVQKLNPVTDDDGYRTTTAHIYGDVEGIALQYSFGWQGASNYPTEELLLDFNGNVDVAYSSDQYKGVSGGGFMVGTDTFDMTLKFQEGKTLYVGTPLSNSEAAAAIELTDYIDNEGNSDPVNLSIIGGNIVTHFARDFSDEDTGLSVFATFQNDNGSIKPGYITVENESIVSTIGRDYGSTLTYGTKAHFSGINIKTGRFLLGDEQYRFSTGFYGGENSLTQIIADELNVYAENYGIRINDSQFNLTSSKSVLIDSAEYGAYLYKGSNATIQANEFTILSDKYGIYGNNENTKVNINNTNLLQINAKTAGVLAQSQANISLNANTININQAGETAKGLWTVAQGQISVNADSFIISGTQDTKNAIYANTGEVDIDADVVSVATTSAVSSYQISAYNSATINLNQQQKGALNLTGGIYAASNSTINAYLGSDSQWKGFARLKEGSINLNFADQAKWQLAYNSDVSKIVFDNGGYIDLFHNSGTSYKQLSTGVLGGQGGTIGFRINMHEDAKNNLANDQLIVSEQASGSHYAEIQFLGNSIPADKFYSENWLVSQADSDLSGVKFLNHDGSNEFIGDGMIRSWALLFTEDESVDENTKWSETGNGKGYWHLVQTGSYEIPEPDDPEENPQPDPDNPEEPENPNPDDKPTPKPDPVLPPEVNQNLVLGTSAGQAVAYLSELDDLRKRIGEVRYGAQDGVWVKAFTRQDRVGASGMHGFKQQSSGINVGWDRLVSVNEDNAWLAGAVLRYGSSNQEGFGRAGASVSGDLDEYTVKAYATWMHAGGSYADFVLQAGRYEQDLDGTSNTGLNRTHASYGTWGYGASIEAGHMFTLNNGEDDRPWFNHWFVEPQAELAYFRVDGADYSTSTGLKVRQDNADFLTGRLGVVLGKKFNYGGNDELDKRYFQLALIGGVKHEFLGGDQDIHYQGIDGVKAVAHADDIAGTRVYYGVNLDWQFSQDMRLFAQFDREEGDDYTKDYDFSVGMKYSF